MVIQYYSITSKYMVRPYSAKRFITEYVGPKILEANYHYIVMLLAWSLSNMQGLQLLRRNHPEERLLPSLIWCLHPLQHATSRQHVYRHVPLSILYSVRRGYSDFSLIYF